VFAQHFQDTAVVGKFASIGVFREEFLNPEFLADSVDRVQFIGGSLVGTKNAEIVLVQFHYIGEEDAKRMSITGLYLSRFFDSGAVFAEIRQA